MKQTLIKTFLKAIFAIAILGIFPTTTFSLDEKSKDCGDHSSNEQIVKVKEIEDFTETMHTIWHDGWVNKDVKMLTEMYPKAETFVNNLEKAGIPKGLEERKDKWERGVRAIKLALTNYKDAIDNKQDKELLDAVERFHQIFESIVATTKPYVKEVEEFHKHMAKMYHRHYPDFDLKEIKKDVQEMYDVIEDLEEAKLPKFYESKKESFDKAVIELKHTVEDLDKYIKKNKDLQKDDKTLSDKVEALHTAFHTLSEIFE